MIDIRLKASALAAVLMLVGLVPGFGVWSADAAGTVRVVVACYSSPERTTVTNATGTKVTIVSVGSIYKPRTGEPYRVSKSLAAGKAITFESGNTANKNVLTHQYIFDNDAPSEGARVKTSIGTFSAHC